MICTIISAGQELDLICKNEYEPPYPELKSRLRSKIWELYCNGYNKFWVNCEYGVPLWCAEIIIALRMYNDIALNIAMPYEEQSTNWVEEHRNRFFRTHAEADRVKIVSNRYSIECYNLADEYMIEKSDLLLVAGNEDSVLYGVRYAKHNNIAIDYLMIL